MDVHRLTRTDANEKRRFKIGNLRFENYSTPLGSFDVGGLCSTGCGLPSSPRLRRASRPYPRLLLFKPDGLLEFFCFNRSLGSARDDSI